MEKSAAVESLGEGKLLLPAQATAALAANDRLKFCLSLLQLAVRHAQAPDAPAVDLGQERAAAGLRDSWPEEMVTASVQVDGEYELPQLARLKELVRNDLALMARPLTTADPATEFAPRAQALAAWIATLHASRLGAGEIARFVDVAAAGPDTVHGLVMAMHRALNALAAVMGEERIDGAHVWGLRDDDRHRVEAFMRGLDRTAWARFDHPGLETAATRSGERLLIQNDIGVNAAHVLVLAVTGSDIVVTYSDLHRARFEFFRQALSDGGAKWSVVEPRAADGLNGGDTYWVGTARFECANAAGLDEALAGIGARIVFLIDWNRARKRLRLFVEDRHAVAILREAARRETGHMGWLRMGGERLVFDAMQAVGAGAFRLGDTLEAVLGSGPAEAFLGDVLGLCARGLHENRGAAQIEDEVRLLLERRLADRSTEFDLAAEHAAFCHEIALSLRDLLAHAHAFDAGVIARAKAWESRADDLVSQARAMAERQPARAGLAQLVCDADDIADALEEATFICGLLAEHAPDLMSGPPGEALLALAETVLSAVRDYVRALAIGRALRSSAPYEDTHEFIELTWRIADAERRADEQLRTARRTIVERAGSPAGLMLATDLAKHVERASDCLMTVAFRLRDLLHARSTRPA
jgi:uncharacterized protein Yka (UPF0111/DUF47 family)